MSVSEGGRTVAAEEHIHDACIVDAKASESPKWDGLGEPPTGFRRVVSDDNGVDVIQEWRGKRLGWNRAIDGRVAFKTQVGGDHYCKMAIQPTAYIMANGLGFPEGNVIKYVSRWRSKGGVADLKKARHYLDLLIAHEEGK